MIRLHHINLSLCYIITKYWIQSFLSTLLLLVSTCRFCIWIRSAFIGLSVCNNVFEWTLPNLSTNNASFPQKLRPMIKLGIGFSAQDFLKNRSKLSDFMHKTGPCWQIFVLVLTINITHLLLIYIYIYIYKQDSIFCHFASQVLVYWFKNV